MCVGYTMCTYVYVYGAGFVCWYICHYNVDMHDMYDTCYVLERVVWYIIAGFSFWCRVGRYLLKVGGQGREFVLSFTNRHICLLNFVLAFCHVAGGHFTMRRLKKERAGICVANMGE